MKKALFFFIIVLTSVSICMSAGTANYKLSGKTVDCIISYYSSMAKAGKILPDSADYAAKRAFFIKNRAMLVSIVAKTGTFHHLERAHQICENLYRKTVTPIAYKKAKEHLTGSGYFDLSTGHRYLKADNNSYAEYSNKGGFIKTVPSDLPLLIKGRSIFPITDSTYILYEKFSKGKLKYRYLAGLDAHPEGWKASKILMALR